MRLVQLLIHSWKVLIMKLLFSRRSFRRSAMMACGTFALLTGCGGGGGDGGMAAGSADSGSTALPNSSINAANSSVVASQALTASSALNSQTSGSGSGLANTSVKQLNKALGIAFLNRAAGLTNTLTINCPQGGTATITLKAANTQQVSSGDSVLVSADSCIDGTDTANGTININFTNVSGKPSSTSPWNGTMNVSFTDFTFDDGTASKTANGALTLAYDQTAARVATFSLTGDTLRLRSTENGTVTERALSGFNTSGSMNGDLFTYRTGFTLSSDAPPLSQSPYTVTTLTDFTQQESSNPSQGALKVTASDGSSLTLTTLDTTNVNIALDSNGDGTAEQTTTTTWSALTDAI